MQLLKRFNNPSFIVLLYPNTKFHFMWDISQLCLLLYTALYAPFRTAFMSDSDFSSSTLLVFETLSDIFFTMDIFVTFLTPFERNDGSLECNIKKIATHYSLNNLLWDMIAIVPTQFGEISARSLLQDITYTQKKSMFQYIGLVRLIRVFKMLKLGKYKTLIFQLIDQYLQFKPTQARLMVVITVFIFIVHIFACTFYIIARMRDFDSTTWLANNRLLTVNDDDFTSYWFVMYWAFQTLTTVGYGDFGAYNTVEIFITLIWMFLGVAFYSFVVGSLTNMLTTLLVDQENLIHKIKSLDEFAKESKLDETLYNRVKNFIYNNHNELFSKIDEEALINELPPTYKEEVFFHQYGNLVYDLQFLQELESDVTWGIVKHLKKSKFEKTDVIYRDKSLSETIYFIYKGVVKLYAENDFSFYEFGSSHTFGDSDMICNIRRIGSAIAFNDCMLYYVHKSQFEMVM